MSERLHELGVMPTPDTVPAINRFLSDKRNILLVRGIIKEGNELYIEVLTPPDTTKPNGTNSNE